MTIPPLRFNPILVTTMGPKFLLPKSKIEEPIETGNTLVNRLYELYLHQKGRHLSRNFQEENPLDDHDSGSDRREKKEVIIPPPPF